MHNKLSLDEIEALRFAEEGSVEKKVFWELQEVVRQKNRKSHNRRNFSFDTLLVFIFYRSCSSFEANKHLMLVAK
jgi:hypothetical protein